jgi:NADH:ubiquinone reductase (H+-translocating)
VDQRDYHHPLPFIWQVVSGSVEPGHITFPLHALLKRGGTAGPVMFKQSMVQGIDVERKVVDTDDGELEWDYLVVALGSTTNFFGMADVEEYSLTLKSLKDAVNHPQSHSGQLRGGVAGRR